jgi:hypothetical protein
MDINCARAETDDPSAILEISNSDQIMIQMVLERFNHVGAPIFTTIRINN